MSDLLAARLGMASSLAFHIIFATAGIGMPFFMVIAEGLWLRTGDTTYLTIARRWARGTAILFAVGAVSGTVLSFELGLLWPRFMEWAGAIIGMPFSLEGFAFFTEAIFLGIYLYGWNRIGRRAHWLAGWAVALSGVASAVFVISANAWMNSPTGFDLVDGQPVNIDPVAAMFNSAWLQQTIHMVNAAYLATAFAVAAIHTALLRRNPTSAFHRKSIAIALTVATITAILQPISGDFSARWVAENQPVKFAAMESLWETQSCAPLTIGGSPDTAEERNRFAIEIPCGLSLLADHDPDAVVMGLDDVPEEDRPPVAITHFAFQLMVACGLAMLAVGLWAAFLVWRRRALPEGKWFQRALMACGPLGFIAIEAGWTVTEVGRQPWIIHNIMRTSEALTNVPDLIVPFVVFLVIYIGLAVILTWLLYRHVIVDPEESADEPHGEAEHA